MSNFKKLMMASAGGGGGSWVVEVVSDNQTPFFKGGTVDSSGNIIVVSVDTSTSNRKFYFVQLNNSGEVNWSKLYNVTVNSTAVNMHYSTQLAVDGSDNIYFAGEVAQSSPTYVTDWHVGKISSSGDYVSSKTLAGISYERPKGIHFDGTNLVSYGNDDANNAALIEMNTSLGVVKNYEYAVTYYYQIFDLTSDSSSNYYGVINMDGFSSFPMALTKWNSSFTEQWTIQLNDTVTAASAIEISGNVYGSGYANSGMVLLKANSSGTVQYQQLLSSAGDLFLHRFMRPLSTGKIVTTGGYRPSGSSKYRAFVAVIDPATPSVDWQQQIEHTTDSWLTDSVMVDGDDNIILVGDEKIVRMTSDGLTAGTYGDYTVASTSLSFSTSTISEVALSPVRATNSYTATSPANSVTTLGYSETLQDLE